MEKFGIRLCGRDITVNLHRKKVKNLILRVRNGEVAVSASPWTPLHRIEAFLLCHADWIIKHLDKSPAPRVKLPPPPPPANEYLTDIFHRIQRQFAHLFTTQVTLKFRRMNSMWGNCRPKTNTITLNTNLYFYPVTAIEYVVLHELCHLKHPDHSKAFYTLLGSLMPDYRIRKRLLKQQPLS